MEWWQILLIAGYPIYAPVIIYLILDRVICKVVDIYAWNKI